MTSNASEKVTPITKEDIVPPVADRFAKRAKANFKSMMNDPKVKWTGNTIIGVFEAGVTAIAVGAVQQTFQTRVRFPRL